MDTNPGSGRGESPDDPLARRVTSLEADMRGVTSTLGRIEITLARMDERFGRMDDRMSHLAERMVERMGDLAERMKQLATKEELAQTTGALNTLSEKVTGLSTRVDRFERTLESKVIGPWQFPLMLAASASVLSAFFLFYNWLLTHGWVAR